MSFNKLIDDNYPIQ